MKITSAGRAQAGVGSILSLMVVTLAGCGGAGPGAGGEGTLSSTASALLTQSWSNHLDAQAKGVAVDRCGNAYVTGSFSGTLDGTATLGGDDLFLAKYDVNGTKLWVRTAGTSQNDRGQAVAVDPSGFIYVAGYTEAGRLDGGVGFGGTDLFVLKYDPAGNRLWDAYWGSQYSDAAYGIATNGGLVYVTGYYHNGSDFILNLDASTGAIGWSQLLTSGVSDAAYGVAVDASGNAYIAGMTYGSLGGYANAGHTDVAVAKYSSTGALQWARLLGTSAYDFGTGVAVDSNGVYVTGYTGGNLGGNASAGGYDAFLAKYDFAGTLQWTRLLGTTGTDHGNAVETYGGDVYVAGSLGSNAFLARYDSNGTILSTDQWSGVNSAGVTGLAIDSSGRPHVAGYDLDLLTNSSFVTKYLRLASYANVLELRSRISNGDGTFCSAAQQFPSDGSVVLGKAVLTADVNGDRRGDMVFAFGNSSGALEIRTKLSNADGTWTSAAQAFGDGSGVLAGKVITGDVNGDGKGDVIIAVANTWTGGGALEIRTKLSNGNGTWSSAGQGFADSGSILGGNAATMAGDVNGDRKSDVIIAFGNSSGALEIRTKLSNGDGTWSSVAQTFGDSSSVLNGKVMTGDVNGDGKTDVVIASSNTSGALEIRTKLSNGNGTWSSVVQTFADSGSILGGSARVIAGDVNADGKADVTISFGNSSGALEIRTKFSNGDGTWSSAAQSFPDGSGVLGGKVVGGDVNADGKADIILAFANTWSGGGALEIRTKFSNGDGTWSPGDQGFNEGGESLGGTVVPADINGDGKADLVSAFLSQG